MNSIVPEKIEYSNLTVYENVAGLLTALLASSNVYVNSEAKSAISLVDGITQKTVKFLEHIQTQSKVTQLSALKSIFMPLMGQSLVITEEKAPVIDSLLKTLLNISDGQNEGMEEMVQGITGLFARIIPSIVANKSYLISKFESQFTSSTAIENEASASEEHSAYEPVKGTKF